MGLLELINRITNVCTKLPSHPKRKKERKSLVRGGAKDLPNRKPMAPVNTRLDYSTNDIHCMPQAVLL